MRTQHAHTIDAIEGRIKWVNAYSLRTTDSCMARSLWEVFRSLFRGGERGEAADEDGESSFVPSPLDVSVRVAHGGQDDEQVRELEEISEHARDIEERQQDP